MDSGHSPQGFVPEISSSENSRMEKFRTKPLPARLSDTRNLAASRFFAETNPAKTKKSHIPASASAPKTAPHNTRGKLGLFF